MDLSRLLSPKSIAVIGASKREGSRGQTVFKQLLDSGYQGTLYPVNPTLDSIFAVKCYPSLSKIQDRLDLALIIVPKDNLVTAMEECAAAQIPGVILYTDETSPTLTKDIIRIAEDKQLALIGPNGFGLINTDPKINLNTIPLTNIPKKGSIACICQEAAMSKVIFEYANQHGIGLSKFVSLGEKAVSNEIDFIRALQDDSETSVILLCVENITDGEEFLRVARTVTGQRTRPKPILAMKTEKTKDQIYKSIYYQSGVIRVDTIQDLFDYARAFSTQPYPKGQRIEIIKKDELDSALNDNNVDGVIVVLEEKGSASFVIDNKKKMNQSPWSAKPLLVSSKTTQDIKKDIERLDEANIPYYTLPELASQCLHVMSDYKSEWLDRKQSEPKIFPAQKEIVRQIITKAAAEKRKILPEPDALTLFKAYGLPVVKNTMVTTEEDALSRAENMGFPVVLKIVSPAIENKTEAGGVKLKVKNKNELSMAYRKITNTAEALVGKEKIWGVIVEEMAEAGQEFYLGSKRVDNFGPILQFGVGGAFVEVVKDISYRAAPLRDDNAKGLIEGIKASQIVKGYKGKSADVLKIEECLVRLSQLVVDFPELDEVILNPLIVYGPGNGARVADGWIKLGGEHAPPM